MTYASNIGLTDRYAARASRMAISASDCWRDLRMGVAATLRSSTSAILSAMSMKAARRRFEPDCKYARTKRMISTNSADCGALGGSSGIPKVTLVTRKRGVNAPLWHYAIPAALIVFAVVAQVVGR